MRVHGDDHRGAVIIAHNRISFPSPPYRGDKRVAVSNHLFVYIHVVHNFLRQASWCCVKMFGSTRFLAE